MTEREWQKERMHAQLMLRSLRNTSVTRTKVGRRKLRLFGCGCCRLIWDHLQEHRLRLAIELAESFSDGQATKQELEATRSTVVAAAPSEIPVSNGPEAKEATAAWMIAGLMRPEPLMAAFSMTIYALPLAGYCGNARKAYGLLCHLLRDIFGNPFRPVAFSPSWRTDTAIALARTMYDSREFSAMPILADALQDAGCDNTDVLSHCRDPKQTHVRGCWVVDLVLDKL